MFRHPPVIDGMRSSNHFAALAGVASLAATLASPAALAGEKPRTQNPPVVDVWQPTPGTASGDIYVSADEPSAAIFLDGNDTGKQAPALLSAVPAGPHTVGVRTQCARAEAQATAATNEVARVELKLVPGGGSVTVTSQPAGAHVFIDGVQRGDTPFVSDVTCGAHGLDLRADGYLPSKRSVQAPAYEVTTVAVVMERAQFGKLTVVPNPIDAAVEVDGVALGTGPRTLDAVSVGSHTIVVRGQGYPAVSRTVDVAAEQVAKVDVTLLPAASAPKDAHTPSHAARYALNAGVGVGGVALASVSVANYLQAADAYHRFLTTPSDADATTIMADEVNPAKNRFIGTAIGAGVALAGSGALWITMDFGKPGSHRAPPASTELSAGSAEPPSTPPRVRRPSHVVDGVSISCPSGARFVQVQAVAPGTSHWAGCTTGAGSERVKEGESVSWPGSGPGHTIETFAAGELQGPGSAWADLDRKLSDGEYDHGKRTGLWRFWDEDGRLIEESSYSDDQKDGVDRLILADAIEESATYVRGAKTGPYTRTASGRKAEEGTYLDGKRTGIWTTYWDSGSHKESTTFVADKSEGPFVRWYESGQMAERGTYAGEALAGLVEKWTESGVQVERGTYVAGKPDGPTTRWSTSGIKTFEGAYSGGKRDGLVTLWSESGVMVSRCNYDHAQKNGLCETWYADGKPKERGAWAMDVAAGEQTAWYATGQTQSRSTYDAQGTLDGLYSEWNADGFQTSTGAYALGRKSGIWTYRDEAGALKETWRYKDGERLEFITGSPDVIEAQRAAVAAALKEKAEQQAAERQAAKVAAKVLADQAVADRAAALKEKADAEAAQRAAAAAAARHAALASRVAGCVDQVVRSKLKWSPEQAIISNVVRIPEPQGVARDLVEAGATVGAGGIFAPEQRADDLGFMGYLGAMNGFNARVAGGFGVVFRSTDFPDGYCPSAADFWTCGDTAGCDYLARANRNINLINQRGF